MTTTRRVLYDPWTGATEPVAGIKKAQQSAQNATNDANANANRYGSNASSVNATLEPTLEKEATNPTGYMPSDLNNMLVAGEQGAGGSNASIAGEAGLAAARTRNTGALSGVLDEAARQRSRATSNAALNVQNQNAMLKERQRQAGLQGLEGLYGTDVNAQIKEQGLVPEDINAWANAGKTGWLQNTEGLIDTVKGSKGPMAFI